jgi:phosphatidate cytidylyltransferase
MPNPFVNPLFASLMWPVLLLQVGGLATILFMERKQLSSFARSALFKHWYTWAALGLTALLAVLSGGIVFVVYMLVAVTILLSEYSNVTALEPRQRYTLLLCGAVMIVAGAIGGTVLLPAVLAVSFIAIAMVSMLGSSGTNFDKAAIAGLGLVYIPFLAVHAVLLVALPRGDGILLALVTATAFSDIGAYIVGKTFGKKLFHGKKLAPALSPNKTMAGVLGGFIGAFAGFHLMHFATGPLPLLVMVALPAIVAITGIAGDLFESLMKRSFGVKDAGTWLPGFGGALDRVDAMLFVIPVGYYFLALANWLG